jgi:rfaE bifunctional protein nucleotidyltransferase chain/domain/rfaE bifunctional protein kinase chain/domain
MTGPLVILGDAMLDVDIEGTATRLSPEAPVPVVDADQRWERPGGAGLAAALAARTEANVVLVTALADDAAGRSLVELLTAAGVHVVALPLAGSTVCKTRIRAGGQSLLRLDHGDGAVTDAALPEEVVQAVAAARAICVADYGKGVSSHPRIRALLTQRSAQIPIVWDPHPRGAEPIPGCTLVTPNQAEAQHFCAESREAVRGDELRRRWQAKSVCVTRGARGAVLTEPTGKLINVPVSDRTAVGHPDACGAGDRFAVAATVALSDGANVRDAVAIAVDAAARFVATGGAIGVSSAAPLAAGGGGVLDTESPFVTTDVDELSTRLRRHGGTLVATGGCFDLLHTGHVRLLAQARQLGDRLVVLLNSDRSVQALKGADRPVMAEQDRARVLSALACVDAVCIFDDLSPEDVLERLRPDIWVKGGDYTESDLPEAAVVRRHGGEVVLLPTVAGYSSSNLIATVRS